MLGKAPADDVRSAKKSALGRVAEFARRRDGATIIEFAMIAPPFLALVVAIIQTGVVFFAQQVLQTGVLESARLILTGQAQDGPMTQAQFHQNVCNNVGTLFNCAGIFVNVQTQSSFGSAIITNPISGGKTVTTTSYNPGVGGDIVIVQVWYEWPVVTGPLNFTLKNLADGNDLLVATTAFRNEHYN